MNATDQVDNRISSATIMGEPGTDKANDGTKLENMATGRQWSASAYLLVWQPCALQHLHQVKAGHADDLKFRKSENDVGFTASSNDTMSHLTAKSDPPDGASIADTAIHSPLNKSRFDTI